MSNLSRLRHLILFAFLLLLNRIMLVVGQTDIQDSIRLFEDIMYDYNCHRRPAAGPTKSTQVHVRLSLSQIIEMVGSINRDVHENNFLQ